MVNKKVSASLKVVLLMGINSNKSQQITTKAGKDLLVGKLPKLNRVPRYLRISVIYTPRLEPPGKKQVIPTLVYFLKKLYL